MTAFRLISLPVHAAFELAAGFALMALPLVLGVSVAGSIASFAAGAIVVGVALGKAVESVPVRRQHDTDWGLVFGLLGGALVLAFAGEVVATLVFAGAALVQLVLNLVTRYSTAR
jgi:uncharacterized membrane protein